MRGEKRRERGEGGEGRREGEGWEEGGGGWEERVRDGKKGKINITSAKNPSKCQTTAFFSHWPLLISPHICREKQPTTCNCQL